MCDLFAFLLHLGLLYQELVLGLAVLFLEDLEVTGTGPVPEEESLFDEVGNVVHLLEYLVVLKLLAHLQDKGVGDRYVEVQGK